MCIRSERKLRKKKRGNYKLQRVGVVMNCEKEGELENIRTRRSSMKTRTGVLGDRGYALHFCSKRGAFKEVHPKLRSVC